MGFIASGISEALLTTETGLLVALPGIIFQYKLAREHQQYKAFLAQLKPFVHSAFIKRCVVVVRLRKEHNHGSV